MKQAIYSSRTQISLSPELKKLIESEGQLLKESLSEYLRKAAILRMVLDANKAKQLELVAEAVVGKVARNKSGWKDIKNISLWQSNLRKDESKHRA